MDDDAFFDGIIERLDKYNGIKWIKLPSILGGGVAINLTEQEQRDIDSKRNA